MGSRHYIESFDSGPGGWLGWKNNKAGAQALKISNGCAISEGPWWIDYNHAPPGAGYLHLPYILHTKHDPTHPAQYTILGGTNRFISGGFPTDFRHAMVSLRIRGELEQRAAKFAILVQARVGPIFSCHVLTATPFEVLREWSEQSVTLEPDQRKWQCLGSRHDRTDFYGSSDISEVLQDVNCNILLVLFPIAVVPLAPIPEPHMLKAGEDYKVDISALPSGYIMLDEVCIQFPI